MQTIFPSSAQSALSFFFSIIYSSFCSIFHSFQSTHFTMKVSAILSLGLSTLALAAPTRLTKRAALDDVATTGYATENGGTTGGSGGETTEVASFDELTAAVKDDTARIVVITGPISGSDSVKIGANKSIIGKDSTASTSLFFCPSSRQSRLNNIHRAQRLHALRQEEEQRHHP